MLGLKRACSTPQKTPHVQALLSAQEAFFGEALHYYTTKLVQRANKSATNQVVLSLVQYFPGIRLGILPNDSARAHLKELTLYKLDTFFPSNFLFLLLLFFHLSDMKSVLNQTCALKVYVVLSISDTVIFFLTFQLCSKHL